MSSAIHNRLVTIATDGFLAGAIALGSKLGLLKALAELSSKDSPATPRVVAEKANCKERYVKEWLCLLATADIIRVNEEELFWIDTENVEELAGDGVVHMYNSFVPCYLKNWKSLAEVFTKDGPLGLDHNDFIDSYDIRESFSKATHQTHLVSEFLSKLSPDFIERLEQGGLHCLDVGSGKGVHAVFMADLYPRSRFCGIDIMAEAVAAANQKRKENGKTFENLEFLTMDGGSMDEGWSDKFDAVFMFDACHDQTRPDLCLKEIYRVMKQGAVFGMLETNGFSNVIKDKAEMGSMATLLYSYSLYHCLPLGSNAPGAVCAGAMWGNGMASRLLNEAGFSNIEIIPTPKFPFNQLYVSKK